ncbi:MAG TPA: ParB/RepB/Spo0J family partition protein [bacterium]|nr:ParB/RepB/Spo0J family partition protein [bacterium]
MAKQQEQRSFGKLGRGLDAMLPAAREESVLTLRIDQIVPSAKQPRSYFDEEKLKELAASLKEHGLIQPIVVRKDGLKYRIIAGERRYRAAKLAGLKELQAVVYKGEKDYVIALTENLQRENLNPLEVAEAYAELMKRGDITQQQLSEQVGKSRPEISNYLRLLTLSDKVKKYLAEGGVTVGQIRPLTVLPVEEQDRLIDRIVAEELTSRQVETLTRHKPRPAVEKDESFTDLERELSAKLQIPIKVQRKPKKIVVSFEFIKMKDFQSFVNDLKKK